MTPLAPRLDRAALEIRFRALADQWKTATALQSSTHAMIAHPAYQAIIGMGRPVVPLLLHELEQEPAHWFEALEAITGENPVRLADWGRIRLMAQAWLEWGRNQGLLG